MLRLVLIALSLALFASDTIAQLQPFANQHGMLLSPDVHAFISGGSISFTMDATGESATCVGYVNLSTGPSTSKVLSAAGSGKISWLAGAITFANGSTNLRIGINDVSTATGLEDGTHDVYADLVGGTDTITASVVNTATMETGTKTIAHGDLIAVTLEMTARGGADSVVATGTPAVAMQLPYSTSDTGSGPGKGSSGCPRVAIQFDDGTLGWLTLFAPAAYEAPTAFGTGSTPDEYALVFEVPFTATVTGVFADLDAVSSTDDFEMILYSDPLGTPVAERTIAQDPDVFSTAAALYTRNFATAFTLLPNTKYAIALRPTTANTLTFQRMNFGTGNAALRGLTPLGTNWSQYTRSDNTGAFGSESTTLLPRFGLWISEFHDGAGSGSSSGRIIGGQD